MSGQTPYDAIKARLVSVFGATYPVIDFEQIEQTLQQGETPFLALDDGTGTATLESVGTPDQNWNRDNGFVVVHVFVPSTGSLSTARGVGDQIRMAMQFQRFPVNAGETLRCLNADPPGPGVVHDGRWHSMLVTIDFEFMYAVDTAPTS